MPPGVLLALCTLVIGWIALLPLRGWMGSLGYHVCAIPVGVLGWSVVASVSMALRSGWSMTLVVCSLALWWALVWAAAVFVGSPARRRSKQVSETPWWTYLVVFVAVMSVSAVFAWVGVSAFSADGWSQYEPDGIILHESGMTSPRALGNRMVVVSALHAAYHFFGGEFTHVIQPVLGLVTALLVATGIWWATLESLRGLTRVAVVAVTTLAMLSNAVYAFHSVYLHSHMVSAMFLILAVVALLRASEQAVNPGWLVVAGFGTAGLLLARPDGAAYALVPVLVAGALLMRAKAPARMTDAFFGPLFGVVALVIAGGIIQHGVWWTRKLSLGTLALFLGLYALAWLFVRVISPGDRLVWARTGVNALRLLVATDAIILLAVWQRWTESVMLSLTNMMSNLLVTGGYRSFWPAMGSVLVVSTALRPRSTRHPFTAYAFFALVQFMVIAFVVHGVRHPGRIGWGDSFTRVSFQAVPVFYLYMGLYLSELVRALRPAR